MRKIVFLAFCLIAMSMTAMADQTMYVMCNPTSNVNIRQRPTTHSPEAGILECGYEVMVDKTAKDNQGRSWSHLTGMVLESEDGWVMSSYLVEYPVEIKEQTASVSAKGRVAIRKSPRGKRSSWVRNGDTLKILAYAGDWTLTSKGYIDSRYLVFEH